MNFKSNTLQVAIDATHAAYREATKRWVDRLAHGGDPDAIELFRREREANLEACRDLMLVTGWRPTDWYTWEERDILGGDVRELIQVEIEIMGSRKPALAKRLAKFLAEVK